MKTMPLLLLIFGFFVGFLYIFQRSFIYFPDNTPTSRAQYRAVDVIEVPRTGHSPLSALWVESTSKGTGKTIVFFHGNAGNAAHRLAKIKPYRDAGFHVLLAEYSGYGGNSGKPSEDQFYQDGRAYVHWLLKEKDTPPQNIIYYGESIGGGVAAQMAAEFDCKGLVLEAPFTSLPEVVAKTFFFAPFLKYLIHDDFDNKTKMKDVECPVFVAIAGQDEVIPPALSHDLFATIKGDKSLKIYQDAHHNNVAQYGLHHDVIRFIRGIE